MKSFRVPNPDEKMLIVGSLQWISGLADVDQQALLCSVSTKTLESLSDLFECIIIDRREKLREEKWGE